jgi:hypothetical protein
MPDYQPHTIRRTAEYSAPTFRENSAPFDKCNLIREVILDRDDATNEAVVVILWNGGRHAELRVSRGRTNRYPADRHPNSVAANQTLGGHWSDREVAATMNRMRCKPPDGRKIALEQCARA